MPDPALVSTVDREAVAFSAEFPHFMANHLPMILVALERLGAAPARRAEWAANYIEVSRLAPPPPAVAPITVATWRQHLGERSRERDYRSFFVAEVARLGIAGALATYLPDLVGGIAASALHALMRTAYGVMEDDPAEVGTGLGYWAATYLPLGAAGSASAVTLDPGEVLVRMGALAGVQGVEPESTLLWHYMRAMARRPAFAPVVDWLEIDQATLPRLADASLALFAATMDFSALHALTGSHWVRLMLPLAPDPASLMRYFWQAIAAVFPRIGSPPLPSAAQIEAWRGTPVPDWAEIKRAAVASEDEHDVSLVFSAFEEWQFYGDPLYRVVAARRVGLA